MKTTLLLTLAGIAVIPMVAMAGGDKGAKYGDRYTQNRNAYHQDAYANSQYNTHYRSADSRHITAVKADEAREVMSIRRSGAATGGAVYSR